MSSQSKHRDRQFFLARGVFGLAAAILVGLVVFIAVRAGGSASAADDAVMVQPSADLRAVESTVVPATGTTPPASPSAPVASSASPSASVSASPSKSSSSPKPSKSSSSPKPSVTKTTKAPVVVKLTVGCSTNKWNGGFVSSVTVQNTGSQPQNYDVTVTYSENVRLVSGPWSNAHAAGGSGTRLTFRGNSAVAPGGSTTFMFQGGPSDSHSQARVDQKGCTVGLAAG
ncbi:cellulose binding domain-containing protein [Actinoplanes sp. L3-i22]|uniref:cellulose binding domain-containing protein n=1 Tax=Actinoplanes sp. L3-i22 TaxID=2836373 RepID=UPI001C743934|nr:cellulose binding domain-containing protein [Actinoplanes sp. L3-i22]BCY05856.1 hypothetical protein L3i22_009440 [Actinoplanes sp. L3-i22]